ncbi:response regulator transcription factor [Odoribacter sp. OttesenSCG-928-L07]|nr:response regulator transcription factor [Odoribacter sp. OttesenSCG-928-L07]MDL2239620.1 response regulator transcription factor [Bacteroidales bacterium OttesenSCG-928-L14]
MINLIVVEDHALFRLGLRTAFKSSKSEINVMCEAVSGMQFFNLLETQVPDLVLLDLILPDMSGIDIARRLKKDYPEVKILILSTETDKDTIKQLMDIGVEGFISKLQSSTQVLIGAILSIMDGEEYFGQDIAAIMYNIYVSKKKTFDNSVKFTQREKEVIELCRNGLLAKDIANKLNISPRTVDAHKNNIFQKMGINNSMEMVQYAIKEGIIEIK